MSVISVIVPIYKVEKYLNRCVDSILNQTFTDFECILVDDGSPDNCGKICDEYAEKDKRIRVIHKKNGGLSDARNAGIEVAQGEYLSFVDSDDWIHPQMLEILYDGIMKNKVMLSACAYEENENEKPFVKIKNANFKILGGLNFLIDDNVTAVVAWNKLYHKSLFDGIRYPVGKLHEDEFVTYKLLYKARDIAFCNSKMYMYFVNPEGITRGENNPRHLDMLDAFEERIIFFREKDDLNNMRDTIHLLLIMSVEQYDEYRKSGKYKHLCNIISKRTKRILKKYSKFANIRRKSNISYYRVAYPNLYKMRCLIYTILYKIKRGLFNRKGKTGCI